MESPVYKMAMDWKVALPLHPEYRTLPMVWYIPPLSPIQNAAEQGTIGMDGVIPDLKSLRIPIRYLANLLTAGDEAPVLSALEKMLAMRSYKRSQHVNGEEDMEVLQKAGLTQDQVEEMYRYMAIANYEDRFVIPASHKSYAEDAYSVKSSCGFSFGNGCSDGNNDVNLFGGKEQSNRKQGDFDLAREIKVVQWEEK
jgi:nitrate reductase beta subunit